jgi:hypothetical protein
MIPRTKDWSAAERETPPASPERARVAPSGGAPPFFTPIVYGDCQAIQRTLAVEASAPPAAALTMSPLRTHTGPRSPSAPPAAGSSLEASTFPSLSKSFATTGALASKATRTHASRPSARAISTVSPALSKRATSRIPGASDALREARAANDGSDLWAVTATGPGGVLTTAVDRLQPRGWRSVALQANARSASASSSRTRRGRTRRGSWLGDGLSIERIHAATSLELDAAVDE